MSKDPLIDELINLISRIEQRGTEKAREELIQRLAGDRPIKTKDETETPAEGGQKQRAKSGTTRQLIVRALKVAPHGLKPAEIMGMARTPDEKSLAGASIYNELSRGAKVGEYVKSGGRWVLPDEA